MMWGWNYSDMLEAMMGNYYSWAWVMYIQWLIIWALGVALLVAAIRSGFGRKGNK